MGRKCSAVRADGQPCQAWAVRASQPPLCHVHGNKAGSDSQEDEDAIQESFYEPTYTIQEVADLVHLALDHSLDDEVKAVRVAVRRVLKQLQEELSPAEFARLAALIFTGANTIARLVRTSQELADDQRDLIKQIIQQVLKEQSNYWRAEL